MANYIKDIEEIPCLKPPQETFVDDPTSLKDIHLDELTFDLSNGLKTINNLHILHVVYIYALFIKFIIKLQEHPQLYDKFRQQLLQQLEEEASQSLKMNGNKTNNETDVASTSADAAATSSLESPQFLTLIQHPLPILWTHLQQR